MLKLLVTVTVRNVSSCYTSGMINKLILLGYHFIFIPFYTLSLVFLTKITNIQYKYLINQLHIELWAGFTVYITFILS